MHKQYTNNIQIIYKQYTNNIQTVYKQYTNICTKYIIKTTRYAVVCILFVFLYDTLLTVAEATETCC